MKDKVINLILQAVGVTFVSVIAGTAVLAVVSAVTSVSFNLWTLRIWGSVFESFGLLLFSKRVKAQFPNIVNKYLIVISLFTVMSVVNLVISLV